MSIDTKKSYTVEELIAALEVFDKEPEVQMLFRRGNKYITNIDVRMHLSDEMKVKLRHIEAMIEDVLVDDKGYPVMQYWDKLKYYNGGAHFFVRFKDSNPKEAILTLQSISIVFHCHKE